MLDSLIAFVTYFGTAVLLVVAFQPSGILGLFVTNRERFFSYGWRPGRDRAER